MATPIEKEQNKKHLLKKYVIIGTITYVYVVLAYLHYKTITFADRRISMSDAMSRAMVEVFTKPFSIYPIESNTIGMIFSASLMGIAIGSMVIATRRLKKHDNPETVNGEAHLMTAAELVEYNKRFSSPIGKVENNGYNNMILSKDIFLAIDNRGTRRNCNILTIGGSGAGKSRFFVGPNILQANCNYVITDPSGELLNDYGKFLEDMGYDVMVFNLTDVYHSNHYNPFEYIKEEKDVFTLVEAFIKNTNPEGKSGGDPFWENSEKLLITACILYLWHKAPKEKQNFSEVVKLIGMADVNEDDASQESPLDSLFNALEAEDPDNLAVTQYKKFKLGAGKTLKSILISVGVRMRAFDLSDIKHLTSSDDFDLYSLGDKKKAIFVIIPTADKTFNFLVAMFYSQIFSTLYTYCETTSCYGYKLSNGIENIAVEHATDSKDSERARKKLELLKKEINDGRGVKITFDKKKKVYVAYTAKSKEILGWRGKKEDITAYVNSLKNLKISEYGRRCDNHIRFLLDEFANIGQIPSFNEKLATMRKYEISCSIILQALSQLKEIYKDSYNTIVANCDTVLFLGSADMETIEWIIKKLSKKTTTVENTSWGSGKSGGNTSYNKSSIELLTADQIQMMDDSEALVCIRGVRPYYGKKYELTNHPRYKMSSESAGSFVIDETTDAPEKKIPLSQRKAKENSKKEDVVKEQVNSTTTANKNVHNVNSPKAVNYANKTNAKESKDLVEQMDNTSIEDDIEDISEAIANHLNINENTPVETIKECIETLINLEYINDEITYTTAE